MSNLNLDGLTDAQLRLFAVRCARRVQHLMTDPRSIAALDVAERHAKGVATDAELKAALAAAGAAARAAERAEERAAWSAAGGAATTALAAAAAALAAAGDAERAEQQKILEQIRKGVKP